ncbi:MAG: hypothetical protein JW973_09845 [Bacteroidales bacterium]|nr:hypothetical protein [Bacteroidales bacterium]
MLQEKYRNQYRISSDRHPGWDYTSSGAYFITICTKNKEHYFGKIRTGTECQDGRNVETQDFASLRVSQINIVHVHYSEIGNIACQYWSEIPDHFPFVELDEFIVMPNHVHGIILFNDIISPVETQDFASLRLPEQSLLDKIWHTNKFGPQSKNLGSVIRGFKSAVKSYATKNNIDFAWQGRYYDRIIRDETEYNRIQKYILDNPANWGNDEYLNSI